MFARTFLQSLEQLNSMNVGLSLTMAAAIAKANPLLAEPGVPAQLVDPELDVDSMNQFRKYDIPLESVEEFGFITKQSSGKYTINAQRVMDVAATLIEADSIYANNFLDRKELERIGAVRGEGKSAKLDLVRVSAIAEVERAQEAGRSAVGG